MGWEKCGEHPTCIGASLLDMFDRARAKSKRGHCLTAATMEARPSYALSLAPTIAGHCKWDLEKYRPTPNKWPKTPVNVCTLNEWPETILNSTSVSERYFGRGEVF